MRMGTSKEAGSITSPEFVAPEGAVLTVVAAPWGIDDNTLDIYFNDISLGSFTFEKGKWSSVSVALPSAGKGRLMFAASKRFFIDDVKVDAPKTDGIERITRDGGRKADNRVYSIDGRYLGNDINSLGHGIYIVNGKKYVK